MTDHWKAIADYCNRLSQLEWAWNKHVVTTSQARVKKLRFDRKPGFFAKSPK